MKFTNYIYNLYIIKAVIAVMLNLIFKSTKPYNQLCHPNYLFRQIHLEFYAKGRYNLWKLWFVDDEVAKSVFGKIPEKCNEFQKFQKLLK